MLGGSRLQVNVSSNDTTAVTGNATGSNGFGVLGLAGPSGNAVGVKGQGHTGVARRRQLPRRHRRRRLRARPG
ncbi:MAG: hypothetical protein R2726_14845 [Acidimicrobiales bacterium]